MHGRRVPRPTALGSFERMRYTTRKFPARARSSIGHPVRSRWREAPISRSLIGIVSSGTPENGLARAHPQQDAPPAERKHMLHRSPTTTDISRRSHARRRLRRAATHRLFCSTNGCTTFLVPDPEGRSATCPVCGLHRGLDSERADQGRTAAN